MPEFLTDQQRKAEEICNQGIDCADEGDWEGAHRQFVQAYQLDPEGAKVCAWLGLTLAVVEKKVQKGLDFCGKGVASGIPDAMFYRNLGKIYLLLNNRRAAFAAFMKGLSIDKTNRHIMREWRSMGIRRKAIVGVLDRSHPINVWLGRVTWNMGAKKRAAEAARRAEAEQRKTAKKPK